MADKLPQTQETAKAIAAGMPPCPVCQGRNVRPAAPVRAKDSLLALLHYRPFRCRTCRCRFYRFHKRRKPPAAAAAGAN